MANFIQKQENGGINSVVLNVSAATPLYLFLACIGSFIILLVIQIVHDVEVWTVRMPTIGIFLGIAGPLFVQVVRFGGLIGSTFNFSKKKILAGVLCIALSVATSLWEHGQIPAMAGYFVTEQNAWTAKEDLTSFLRILIWIGLGLEILIVASIYGKTSDGNNEGDEADYDEEQIKFLQKMQLMDEASDRLERMTKHAEATIAQLQNQQKQVAPLVNGNGVNH